MVQRLSDERVPQFIAAHSVTGAASQDVGGKLRIDPVKYFKGLAKAFALERHEHQQVNIGVHAWRSVCVRPKQDDTLRMKFARDSI